MIRRLLCWLGFHTYQHIYDFEGNDFWGELYKKRVKSYHQCKYCGRIKK